MVEFIAVRCYSCRTCQCIQKPKSRKFQCRVCSEKQSVKHVFATSYAAKDIRQVVMQLNMQRQQSTEEDQLEFRGAGGGAEDDSIYDDYRYAVDEEEIRLDDQGRILQANDDGQARRPHDSIDRFAENAPAQSRWSQLLEEEDDPPIARGRALRWQKSSQSSTHPADPLSWLNDTKASLNHVATDQTAGANSTMFTHDTALQASSNSSSAFRIESHATAAQQKRKRSLSPPSTSTFSTNHMPLRLTACDTEAVDVTEKSKSFRLPSLPAVLSTVSPQRLTPNHSTARSTTTLGLTSHSSCSTLELEISTANHGPHSFALISSSEKEIDDCAHVAKRTKGDASNPEQPLPSETCRSKPTEEQAEPDRFSWLDEMERETSNHSTESHEQHPSVSAAAKPSSGSNLDVPSAPVPMADSISSHETQETSTAQLSRWAWLEEED